MEANATATANPVMLSPQLAELSDSDLLAGTRRLVGASNQLLASLLAHLAEVEARGVHRTRACSSLYIYCIYELRLSEDVAFRRVSAARLLRRFPALFDAIASGELHLTALLMLGPHLTAENFSEVLARAKHRTKREIGRLLRELDPLPDVPPRIEPLGPAPTHGLATRRPTWEMFMLSLNPVRALDPGDRPRDWMDDGLASLVTTGMQVSPELALSLADGFPNSEEQASVAEPAHVEPTSIAEPAPEAGPVTGPRRYKVQFTATAEYVELVERAQALLSSVSDGAALADVHLRAMRELVVALEKRKYGADRRPRQPRDASSTENVPRQRGRYIPAAVRREVFERDAARCTYVDSSGQRCRETRCLELHHLQAFARGGPHQACNLTLRCRAHNLLAAEEDLGRELVEQKRLSTRHEPFSSKAAAETEPVSSQGLPGGTRRDLRSGFE